MTTDLPPRGARELIEALQRREESAAAQVLQTYGTMLRGFLTDALEDPGAVDDVLQQTMLEVWRRGPEYRPARGSLTTWLLVIARSRAIDHLRRRVPEPYDPADLSEFADPSAEAQLEVLAERWRVLGLLMTIPREEARLLGLRFYGGLNQREIAEQTGIALGTVKMRMAAGLERLREGLAEADRP